MKLTTVCLHVCKFKPSFIPVGLYTAFVNLLYATFNVITKVPLQQF